MNRLVFGAGALLGCVSLIAQADDWPRFRGPEGSGVSKSVLPISWTPSQNVAWRAELPGAGVSSPIVVGNRVFVTCYSGYGLDRQNPGDLKDLVRHLVCLDASTGKQLCQRDVPAELPEDPYSGIGVTAHGYASHTPVSDGKHVYVFFGKSGVYAFDLNGQQVWHTEVGKESDPRKWGSSSSPILYDDVLIVTASAESQALVGLDKATGRELWRQPASGLDNTWSTPTLARISPDRVDMVLSVPQEVWGLNPETGKLRWLASSTEADQTHSSAIASDGKIFVFTGRGSGSVAIQPGGQGDISDSAVVWKGRDSARFASPVAYQSHLYLIAEGILTKIDAQSGKRIRQVRLSGGSDGRRSDYASPIIAGDRLYYVNGAGETFVFGLAKDMEQISLNLLTTDSESFGGSPAISDGRLYLRSDKALYCVADLEQVAPNASVDLIAKTETAESPAQRGGPGGRGGFGGRGGPGGGAGRFDPAALFNSRDADNDGKLTKAEVAGSPMERGFENMDSNDDGAITLEEFQTGMRNMFAGGGRGAGGGPGGRGGRGEYGAANRPERPQRPEFEPGDK